MRPIQLPAFKQPKISAKTFLLEAVPKLLSAVNIAPTQSFYGFKINIDVEATKRIQLMSEAQAERALNALKVEIERWKPNSTD